MQRVAIESLPVDIGCIMQPDAIAPHPTCAVIDRAAFRHNLDAVRSYVGPEVRIMAVVKANAYGHGAIPMAEESLRHGVEFLAVARIHEALELRTAGISHPLLLLEALQPEHVRAALESDIQITVMSVEDARRLSPSPGTVQVHVKIDTGMGRLGCDHRVAADTVESIARLPRVHIAGIYSHFATSEDPDQSFALEQLDRFRRVLDELSHRKVEVGLRHMANSGAIISLPASHLDMVRPGIMLYGYPPLRGMVEAHPVRPVMTLRSRVTFLKTVEAGTSVSYGRRWFAPSRSRVATVPIGYADGFSRLLTNRSSCLIRGKRYPVVGTVCMDHVMVDVGPEAEVDVGDGVTFIGADAAEKISAWDIAATVGTIPYEVTCLVTPRVPRIFR